MPEIVVSAACARQMFTECGPECIRQNNCFGNCCDAPSRPNGTMITVHPSEQHRIELLGATVRHGMLEPKPGQRICPFKLHGLCSLHSAGTKPIGCVVSPFTLNSNGTLIVRNRYRMLPCYKGPGIKAPAYRVFFSSLAAIFGPGNARKLASYLDAGGGDARVPVTAAMRSFLLENDRAKKDAKRQPHNRLERQT